LVQTAFQTANVSNGDEQNFVNRLRASDNYLPELALVAEAEGQLLGHIMLTRTFLTTPKGQFPLLLLGPVAVVLEHRKQGIGTALIEAACQRARAFGHQAVILVGDPDFYHRFGFQPAAAFGIANANEIPDPYVLVRELAPGALANLRGTITFQE
jgi:predicted N-acetyltransferase YhbS